MSFRNLVCVVMGILLAAFALPSIGGPPPNKLYYLSMSATGSTITATVFNNSPSGSSASIASVDLFLEDLNWIIHPPASPDGVAECAVVNNVVTCGSAGNWDADTSVPGRLRITNLDPVKPKEWVTVTFNVDGCGDAIWSADPYSGSNASGNLFQQDPNHPSSPLAQAACGGVPCNSSLTASNVTAFRSSLNKDGTDASDASCGATSVYISNTANNFGDLSPNIVHFRWVQAGMDELFSTAVFDYIVTFATAPTLENPPQVGWKYLNGDLAVGAGADPNANPDNPVVFIPAPQCDSDILPFILAHLVADVAIGDKKIQVDTSANAPAVPFSIVIGTERMLVTKIVSSNNTWTVTRHTGGTQATEHIVGVDPDAVMSTPLSLLPGISPMDGVTPLPPPPPPYAIGDQAQMCVPPGGVNGNAVEFFDFGDGWGSHP